jgi:hypothetical protein
VAPQTAAPRILALADIMRAKQASGVAVKEELPAGGTADASLPSLSALPADNHS